MKINLEIAERFLTKVVNSEDIDLFFQDRKAFEEKFGTVLGPECFRLILQDLKKAKS